MTVALAASSPSAAGPAVEARVKALAFDGFALFDLQPVFALAETVFPGKGGQLSATWRVKIFEYTWLRASSGHYEDFASCIDGALSYATASLKLPLTPGTRQTLLDAFATIKAFPDVAPALRAFRMAGLRLAILANPTPAMLEQAVANSNLEGVFDAVISTDQAKTYKPHPKAYGLGTEILRLNAPEIGFVASASWDAVGAKWFGYRSLWVNRPGASGEALGVEADKVVGGMAELVPLVVG
ncbi:haloacid dehalogenase type II [Sphingobium sp. AS12]|uniref:haloacid dehalogenase type II n=1 Tax=Sphingobium sp. AS12 TaxID=2849495 RepID=UPI001C317A25|nr:haloacid dehalogenase type II [Sphingobium sp. AS12]MBV2150084.1 haloacid dehalogenase type II [Sphingobium sp. AS12]